MNGRPRRGDGDTCRLLFRVAAGPRLGYGHLVRVIRLARALDVAPRLSIRGGRQARTAAARLGASIERGTRAAVMARLRPRALVVDDPSARCAAPWFRLARRLGALTVGLHDLGLGCLEGDLVIDGSAGGPWATHGTGACVGPRFVIIDPDVTRSPWRATDRPRHPRVLVALGGGAPRRMLVRVAGALRRRIPDAEIRVASGFTRRIPRAPAGVTWLGPLPTLAAELSSARVAIVGGGVTAYEACAAGVPAVAVALVEAQRRTVAALADLGAVADGGLLREGDSSDSPISGLAELVLALLHSRGRAARQSRAGRTVTDGQGAERVARLVRKRMGCAPRSNRRTR